tara:strand:- start:412 stop:672 length:261 start_codon:yes stop_codon:yes gene_type:complete
MVSMVTHEDAAEEKQAEIQGLVSLTNAMNPPGVSEEEYLESLVECVDCYITIGTEKEVYDEESVEWYNINGLVYCPSCKNKLEVRE